MAKLDQEFRLEMSVIEDDDLGLLIPQVFRNRALRVHDENSPPLPRQVVQEKGLPRSRRSREDPVTCSGLEPLDIAVTADRLNIKERTPRGRYHRERSRLTRQAQQSLTPVTILAEAIRNAALLNEPNQREPFFLRKILEFVLTLGSEGLRGGENHLATRALPLEQRVQAPRQVPLDILCGRGDQRVRLPFPIGDGTIHSRVLASAHRHETGECVPQQVCHAGLEEITIQGAVQAR